MRLSSHLRIAWLVALTAVPAAASSAAQSELGTIRRMRVPYEAPFRAGGALSVEVPQGSITIRGTEGETIKVEALVTIRGVDERATVEGLSSVRVGTRGNQSARAFYVAGPRSGFAGRWAAIVDFEIDLPRTASVRLNSTNSSKISVRDLEGILIIRNFNGRIDIESGGSPVFVDTVNGKIDLRYTGRVEREARLSSLNGSIDVTIPSGSQLEWIAETFKGNIRASRDLAGQYSVGRGVRSFRALIGRTGGPSLKTSTISGEIALHIGSDEKALVSLIPDSILAVATPPVEGSIKDVEVLLPRKPTSREFVLRRSEAFEDIRFETQLGNVLIGDIRGNAWIVTRAGEINIGRVIGKCHAESWGGPINLGEIWGDLFATTSAGDITIRAALAGGSAGTNGGNVTIGKSTGAIELTSGGGDITVQNASGPVTATTKSGDIFIAVDDSVSSIAINARTIGGNVILSVPRGFGGKIDATALTSSDRPMSIDSDLPGLRMVRDEIDGRSRVRASGTLNRGEASIVLVADEGSIQIRTR